MSKEIGELWADNDPAKPKLLWVDPIKLVGYLQMVGGPVVEAPLLPGKDDKMAACHLGWQVGTDVPNEVGEALKKASQSPPLAAKAKKLAKKSLKRPASSQVFKRPAAAARAEVAATTSGASGAAPADEEAAAAAEEAATAEAAAAAAAVRGGADEGLVARNYKGVGKNPAKAYLQAQVEGYRKRFILELRPHHTQMYLEVVEQLRVMGEEMIAKRATLNRLKDGVFFGEGASSTNPSTFFCEVMKVGASDTAAR